MKSISLLAFALVLAACQAGPDKRDLKTQMDSVSYTVGLTLGKQIAKDSIQVDADLLARGIKDQVANKAMLNDSQIAKVMKDFQEKMMAQMQEKHKKLVDANAAEGKKFLDENKSKPGVVTLPDGVQYIVLTEGTGAQPKATDEVVVNYRGTLINGTVFDSATGASLPLNGVIPGWSETLQKMKVGSKWRIFIPGERGYGEQGAGEKIGPNATLIFEVELLSIKAPTKGAPSGAPNGMPPGAMPQGGGMPPNHP